MTLLYGEETRVMYLRIGRTLCRFNHRVYHQLDKIELRRDMISRRVYPPLEEAMTAVGLGKVETCVLCFLSTDTHYIATLPILELYMAADQRPGAWVMMRWCEQVRLDLGQKKKEKDTYIETERETKTETEMETEMETET